MADNEMIFVHSDTKMSEVDLFMGFPGEDITFQFFTDREILAHLVFRAGLFPSVGQAKKNGWDKPIPAGFSQFVVSKRKFKVFILGVLPPRED